VHLHVVAGAWAGRWRCCRLLQERLVHPARTGEPCSEGLGQLAAADFNRQAPAELRLPRRGCGGRRRSGLNDAPEPAPRWAWPRAGPGPSAGQRTDGHQQAGTDPSWRATKPTGPAVVADGFGGCRAPGASRLGAGHPTGAGVSHLVPTPGWQQSSRPQRLPAATAPPQTVPCSQPIMGCV